MGSKGRFHSAARASPRTRIFCVGGWEGAWLIGNIGGGAMLEGRRGYMLHEPPVLLGAAIVENSGFSIHFWEVHSL